MYFKRRTDKSPRSGFARSGALLFSGLLFGSLWAGDAAQAAIYSATATVALMRSHDTPVSQDWFQLTGVSSLGNCAAVGGLVLVVLKDDDRSWRHFAMVLNAKRTGAALTVFVDDTLLTPTGGFCYLQYMQQ